MNSKLACAVLAALPLAACTPVDATFGGAVKHNNAVQIIDPDPEYAGTPIEGGDGQRAAKAVERYKKGEVKQPANTSTTSVRGGSGGAGGGSSSGG